MHGSIARRQGGGFAWVPRIVRGGAPPQRDAVAYRRMACWNEKERMAWTLVSIITLASQPCCSA